MSEISPDQFHTLTEEVRRVANYADLLNETLTTFRREFSTTESGFSFQLLSTLQRRFDALTNEVSQAISSLAAATRQQSYVISQLAAATIAAAAATSSTDLHALLRSFTLCLIEYERSVEKAQNAIHAETSARKRKEAQD